VVTVVDATIDASREADLIDGFRAMTQQDQPDALVHSELLRGLDGTWRIQTTWHDMESLKAVRVAGKPHAIQLLLESLDAENVQTSFYFVAETFRAS
jgi:hypothetical protein